MFVCSPLPVRASALTAAARVRDGIVAGHGGSTTFPWVPSRPVQMGYDRAVRAAWGSWYHLVALPYRVVLSFVVIEAICKGDCYGLWFWSRVGAFDT